MFANVQGKSFPLREVGLTLAAGGFSEFDLYVSNEGPVPLVSQLSKWSSDGEEVTLRWNDIQIKLVLSHFGLSPRPDAAWRVCAVAADEDQLDWLEMAPATTQARCLVYQRRSPAPDTDAWRFINRMAGYRLVDAPPPLAALVERLLPSEACLLRADALKNRQFLDQIVAFLRGRLGDLVLGWCGLHRAEQPINLISQWWPAPFVLDDSWEQLPQRQLSEQYVYRRVLETKNPEKMLESLCQHGTAEGAATIGMPGVVEFGKQTGFGHRVTHHFDAVSETVKTTVNIVKQIRCETFAESTLLVDGLFNRWVEEESGEPLTRASVRCGDGRWVMMSEQQESADEEGCLRVSIVAPGGEGDEAADSDDAGGADQTAELPARGIYIRHREGDKKQILLAQGEQPAILGEKQRYRSKLEKADVTVLGPLIDIRVSPPDQNKPEGAILDAEQGKIEMRLGEKSQITVLRDSDQTIIPHLVAPKSLSVAKTSPPAS